MDLNDKDARSPPEYRILSVRADLGVSLSRKCRRAAKRRRPVAPYGLKPSDSANHSVVTSGGQSSCR